MTREQIKRVNELQSEFEYLVERGQFAAALPIIQELEVFVQQSAGDSSDAHDTCLDNIAGTLFHLERYQESAELHQQIIRSRDKKMVKENHDVENNLDFLAKCYCHQGDFVSAEPVMKRLLSIREKNGPALAEMGNLAVLLREQGKNDQAENLYKMIIAQSEKTVKSSPGSHATVLNNYGFFLKSTGRLSDAVPFYLDAVGILAEIEDERALYLTVLANLASVFEELGDDKAVKDNYDRLSSLFQQWPGIAPEVKALILNNQAQWERHQGNFQSAKRKFQESMEIVKSVDGVKHPRYATAMSNLGTLYMDIGDETNAEQNFQQALNLRRVALGNDSPELAQSLNNLGELARRQGNIPKALLLLQEALEVKQRAYKGPHPSVATSMNNLGYINVLAQRWDDAKKLFQDTLIMLDKTVGRHHPDYSQTLQNLGDLHKRRGEYEVAEGFFKQSRSALLEKYGSGHNYVIATINLAELYAATERADEALSTMNEVATLDQGTVSRVFSFTSERQWMTFLRDIKTREHVYLSLIMWKFLGDAKVIHEAFKLVLKRKAITAEVLTGLRDGILGGHHANLRTKLEELTALRRMIASATLAGSNAGRQNEHSQSLKTLESQREKLEAQLSSGIPEIELVKRLEEATPEAISQKLSPGSVLVEFLRLRVRAFEAIVTRGDPTWKPDRYIAFVISSGRPNALQLLDFGDAEAIDNLVSEYRYLVSVPPGRRSYSLEVISKRLRIKVFDPLLSHLNGSRTLILCTDGELNTLPFEALALEDGRFVIEEYQISYLACGREALRFGLPSTGKASESIVVADPAYNLTAAKTEYSGHATRTSRDIDRGMRFGPLRHTRGEGEKVAELLGVKPWLGEDALEGRIKQARSPQVLHLATHGFVLPDQTVKPPGNPIMSIEEQRLTGVGMENPLLRSGLALAGVNIWMRGGSTPVEAEDGLLTAEDVTGMNLLDTELVTLSACETGLGKVHIGEGIFGFRRAFMLAGARRLIMSLWKVPDLQTKELMIDFYKRLLAGDRPADALRDAKLAMKGIQPDPYYWAAFVFLGDPSSFQLASSTRKVE
jgi:CHAT domain-containing protein/tetratricopeptide (TPR) repeat protein